MPGDLDSLRKKWPPQKSKGGSTKHVRSAEIKATSHAGKSGKWVRLLDLALKLHIVESWGKFGVAKNENQGRGGRGEHWKGYSRDQESTA